MKEVKGFFKTIIELWGNPRLRGVVQLIFWVIFFAIVAIWFRTGKSSDTVNKTNVDSNTTIKEDSGVASYEYEYIYTENDNVINITGTHYGDKEKFIINGSNYYSITEDLMKISMQGDFETWGTAISSIGKGIILSYSKK